MKNKLTIEYIKSETPKLAEGYECLTTEYINAHIELPFKCNRGHIYFVSFNKFQQGRRCPLCYKYNRKSTIKTIKQLTKEIAKGYKCNSKIYKDYNTKMSFTCNKNHKFESTWRNFNSGKRCKICFRERHKILMSGKNNPSWKGGIKEKNISLYATYAHKLNWCEEVRRDPKNKDYLQIKCTNCNKWFIPKANAVSRRILAINNIGYGSVNLYCSDKCKQTCSIYKQRLYLKGEKPYHTRKDQPEWAEMVKKRDNNICQICGAKGKIAHHIEGLNVNPIMSADIDMGITLCKKCDKQAHSDIGCRPIDLRKEDLCQ